jgi:hypothetical protein
VAAAWRERREDPVGGGTPMIHKSRVNARAAAGVPV